MQVGAVVQPLVQPTLAASDKRMQLARQAGLASAVRFVVTWSLGDTEPSKGMLDGLQNAAAAASAAGADAYLVAYPFGSSQTPLTDDAQDQFASWVAALANALPTVLHIEIGNEPNLNRFWLPQFGPDGEDVAATAYESLLARSYDALKAVSPQIDVLGGALSHAGGDRPGTGRDTHSPTQFILDLGAAYRATGRQIPIMDAFAFHPYMLTSSEPPTLVHPNTTVITIADYGKLASLLGQAFDGTAQRGSTLPIVYDEFGVESTFPASKASLYTGSEPATTHPVDQSTQAAYYRQAFALAFCQPNVRAILVFSLIDETALSGWQSGVFYADDTSKTSLAGVAAAAAAVRHNTIAVCPGLHVTPRPVVVFLPFGPPGSAPSRFPVPLTCDVDCTYRVRLERLPSHATVLEQRGRAPGGLGVRITFPSTRLASGRYRLTLQATATQNIGTPFKTASAGFVVPAP